MKRMNPVLTTFLFLALVALSAGATAGGATFLGERHVRDLRDTDTIRVGRSLGHDEPAE